MFVGCDAATIKHIAGIPLDLVPPLWFYRLLSNQKKEKERMKTHASSSKLVTSSRHELSRSRSTRALNSDHS